MPMPHPLCGVCCVVKQQGKHQNAFFLQVKKLTETSVQYLLAHNVQDIPKADAGA
jgi:hypothetical protein